MYQFLKNMLYRHMMKLNDSRFIRFSLNDSPHIKISGPVNRLFQQIHIADRSTESFHATEILLIPQTSNFTISLTLKTRTVTECDLLLHPLPAPGSALTETGNKEKSMFKIAPCKTSICDRCMYKVLIHLKQNCRGSWRHKITSIL